MDQKVVCWWRGAVLLLLFLGVSLVSQRSALAAGITLSWSPSPDANVIGYNVYYGSASRSYTIQLNAGNTTNLTISGLADGVTYYFAATAYNAVGLESDYSSEVSYTVPGVPGNQPPTLNAIGNTTLSEDAAQQSVPLSGISSGSSNEVQTLTVTATSSNPGLIPNPTVNYSSPGTTGNLTFTPVANGFGSATITVSVNDGGAGGIITRTFTVTVNSVNDQPTLNALNDLTINEDAGQQSVALTGISSGAANENQTLTISATSSNPGLIPNPTVSYTSPNATGSLIFTPVANASGSAVITVTLNDGAANNNLITRAFTITVNAVNDAPTLNAIGNLTLNPNAGLQTVNLTGITSGAANESQTLTVSAVSSNPGLIPNPTVNYSSANSTGTLTFTPVAATSGTAVITVTVNDGGASNNTVSRAFTVAVDAAPTISVISNQTIGVNSNTGPIGLVISDSDTPASSLTLSASSSLAGLIPTNGIVFGGTDNDRTVTVTPIIGQTGVASITIFVSDGTVSSSTTFQVTVLGTPAAPQVITVLTNGAGTIVAPRSQSLTAGKVVTLTAVPATGQEFVNWSGGLNSSVAKISFVVRSNMVLQANFVPSPYSTGFYNGLFYEDDDIRLRSAGSFKVSVGQHGVYSGRLQLGGSTFTFSGKLDLQCRSTNYLARVLASPLVLNLELGTNTNAGQIFGSLTDGNWVAHLRGGLAVYGKTNAAPFAGTYTMAIPSDETGNATPEGHGYGTLHVSPIGSALFAGILADGTKVTQSASLSKDGAWPIYAPLYKGAGALVSWMNFENRTQDDFHGTMRWLKTTNALAAFYPAGIDAESEAIGSLFQPVVGTNILNASAAVVDFNQGNLPAGFQNLIHIAGNNAVANLSSNRFQMTLSGKAGPGIFRGKVTDPLTGKIYAFGGAVLQKARTGYGFMLGTNLSSRVELTY